MMNSTAYFRNLYDLIHNPLPFYGSGLEESLERISDADLHRPVGHRTIAQLLGHMLAWRYDLSKRLHGQDREKIEMNSPADWPDVAGKSKADFLAEFAKTKQLLQTGMDKFDASTLNVKLHPDYAYTNVQLLEGGAHHDIYHLGQINLIAAILKNS